MSTSILTVYAALILTPTLLSYIVLVQWPVLAHSRYHANLWRIRDRVMDDVLAGNLAWSPGARNLIQHLESLAFHSREFNLLTAIFILKMDVVDTNDLDRFEDLMLGADTPITDRNRLLGYLNEAERATIRHLTFAGIEGLAGALYLLAAILKHWVSTSGRRAYTSRTTPAARAEMLQTIQRTDPPIKTA